jgi:hypothetical protein
MIKKTFDLAMRVPNGVVTKPITVVQLNNKYWIDLQSVMLALGMSWPKWQMYFRGCADKFGLLLHDDGDLLCAVLVPPMSLLRLVDHLYMMPCLATRWTARNRMQGMDAAWTATWLNTRLDHAEDKMVSRKVSAATVRELHTLFASGETLAACALKLGINSKTANRLKNGTYPMDRLTTLAWYETFGGAKRPG